MVAIFGGWKNQYATQKLMVSTLEWENKKSIREFI